MNKSLINQKVKQIFRLVRPWVGFVLLLLVLRYTGILSGLSVLTQSALMQTGIMDIKPKAEAVPKSFDYNFSIQDLEGKEVNMADYKGKVIFLNLWATWCGPCRAEMPSIQELYDKVDHDKIAFVMLALDTDENKHKISRYIADQSFSFPVFRPYSSIPNQLRVSVIPTTIIVGADGKIILKNSGAANYGTEEFRKFLLEHAEDSAN